jgi:rubrerythrin
LAIDTMRASCQSLYPPALSQAQDAGNADAARTFNFSRMAQESNLQLFELASADSATWKSNGAGVHICTVCGWLSLDERFEKCPICFAPKAQVELMR